MASESWHRIVPKIFLKLALVSQLVTPHLRACLKVFIFSNRSPPYVEFGNIR